jgi:predicted transcriptional regulator
MRGDFVAASPIDADGFHPEEVVALLATEGHHTQADIARILKVSQSKVSRLLTTAEEKKLLVRIVQNGLSEERSHAIRAYVNQLTRNLRLTELLARQDEKGRLKEVHVIHSPVSDQIPDDIDPWEARCHEFGRRASRLVLDLIRRGRLIGVSYGRTLASMVDGIRHVSVTPPPSPEAGPRFFPLWTEPYEDSDYRFVSKLFPNAALLSSTRLARAIANAITGKDHDVPILNCFPSLLLLDKTFSEADIDVIRRFYHTNESFETVFGTPAHPDGGFVSRMDTALIGIGTTQNHGRNANPNYHVSKRALRIAGFSEDVHELAYVGDAGGAWLRRTQKPGGAKGKKNTAEIERYVTLFERRWMGPTQDQIARCAATVIEDGPVGVIAMAVGRERRAAVLESIRCSLVNRLIIDTDLAMSLDAES